jgi:hypothetical protein
MRAIQYLLAVILVFLIASCNRTTTTPMQTVSLPTSPLASATAQVSEPASQVITQTPTATALPEPSSTPLAASLSSTPSQTPTSLPTLSPEEWKNLPVIPHVSETVKEIYIRGVALGNNPRAFSKIGDCGSTPAWFLGDFDRGPTFYRLGEYQYLEPVIQEFQGSYGRTSLAAKSGFNASSIFAPLWANRDYCLPDETPLACEYRVQRPILAFIMLGSNDVWHLDTFEPQMRKIIEFSINNGVIPILSTKADNLEKDHIINLTIARLAEEYQIPLLNFWRAVQELPNKGLQEDDVHITWGPNRFDDSQVMKAGWPVRNLTSLQTLDAVWRTITDQVKAQE